MNLSAFFEPISNQEVPIKTIPNFTSVGDCVTAYREGAEFPSLEAAQLVILGVSDDRRAVGNKGCAQAPDAIRKWLYELARPCENCKIVDLGNILPGKTPDDTVFAVSEVLYKLIEQDKTVVILGGSQEFTFANYKAFEILGRIVNVVAIDSRFDLHAGDGSLASNSYLEQIILQKPNYLFNFCNIGYQTYLCGNELVNLMDELQFDTYRLGGISGNIDRAEPLIRAADMMTVDVSAVRMSDAPGNGNSIPHGFYGEELCQMMRYAGYNDRMQTIGFYEYNPIYDNRGQTAQLYAQALWFFIEGFCARKNDSPLRNPAECRRFHIEMKDLEQGMDFFKSKQTDRWWVKIPCDEEKGLRYGNHVFIPCTYDDYKQAMENEIPDVYTKFFMRINNEC